MWHLQIFGIYFFDIFYNFFIYAIFGWIYECCLVSFTNKAWVNRGFLNGPIIPIYGIGATLIYVVFWQFKGNYILVFIGGMLLATILEYTTSYLMELVFHTKWWDYSQFKFNIRGRVCLLVSLFWGILSLLVIEIFQPLVLNLIQVIPENFGYYFGYLILIVFVLDITITVVHTVKMETILKDLQKLKQEFTDYIESTKLYETKEELKHKISGYKISELLDNIKMFIDENKERLIEKNKNREGFELKKFRVDIEIHAKEYVSKLQNRISRISLVQKRLLKAFPNIRSSKNEIGVKDKYLHQNTCDENRRWLSMSSIFKDDVAGTSKSYLSGSLRFVLVGFLVLVQFAVIFLLTYWLSEITIYFYILIEMGSIMVTIGLVNDNRSASYKISWICIVLILPITGHIMYALWGKTDSKKKIEKKVLAKINHGNQYLHYNEELFQRYSDKFPSKCRMSRYMETQHFPLTKNNKINYYPMGEDTFEAIFDDIMMAKKFILINFFIVAEGVLWDKMHEILLQKIKEGIQVKFMYDDFGATLRTCKNFKKNLEAEGFEIGVFNPIHKYTDKLYMNYRSHQKIIVIDGNVGYTGGMNLADEYVNLLARFGRWKDNAVRVEGDAVWGLTVTFLQMWEICNNKTVIDYNPYRPSVVFPENDVYCHVIADGPANNPNNPIEIIYKQIIHYATKYLYITTPYLIIEDDLKEALIVAVKSGIDVRIITPYIPDKKNVKVLTNYNYGQLLEAGVRIFEYKPGFIHAKTIINEDCGIVGTINMDYRSFYLHYECGLWMCDKDIIKVIKDDLVKTMEESIEITYNDWKNRPWYLKIYQLVLNLFSTLM
jgi:cardiolipin synthase